MNKKILKLTIGMLLIYPLTLSAQNNKKLIKDYIFEEIKLTDKQKKEIFADSSLSTKMQFEWVDYLVSYKKYKKLEVRSKVASLLSELPNLLTNLEAQQAALYHALDMHYVANYNMGCFKRDLFTEKILNRAIEILKGPKKEESALMWNDNLQEIEEFDFDKEEIKEVQKELGCNKKVALDTLRARMIENDRKYFWLKGNFSDKCHLIKLFGWLNKKEYAPKLVALIGRQYQKQNTKKRLTESGKLRLKEWDESIYLALARLQYKDYNENEVVQAPQHELIPRYLYTQEAYWHYIEYNNSIEIIRTTDCWGDGSFSSKLSIAVFHISRLIYNLPKECKFYGWVDKKEQAPQLIEKTKKAFEWLKQNKGKYEIRDQEYFCI